MATNYANNETTALSRIRPKCFKRKYMRRRYTAFCDREGTSASVKVNNLLVLLGNLSDRLTNDPLGSSVKE